MTAHLSLISVAPPLLGCFIKRFQGISPRFASLPPNILPALAGWVSGFPHTGIPKSNLCRLTFSKMETSWLLKKTFQGVPSTHFGISILPLLDSHSPLALQVYVSKSTKKSSKYLIQKGVCERKMKSYADKIVIITISFQCVVL